MLVPTHKSRIALILAVFVAVIWVDMHTTAGFRFLSWLILPQGHSFVSNSPRQLVDTMLGITFWIGASAALIVATIFYLTPYRSMVRAAIVLVPMLVAAALFVAIKAAQAHAHFSAVGMTEYKPIFSLANASLPWVPATAFAAGCLSVATAFLYRKKPHPIS